MRILFCLGSMTKGGAERVVANLANWLISENEVAIVVTPPNKSSYKLDDKVTFYTLDNFNDKKSNLLIRNIRRVKRLNKFINEFNPDIILSFLPEPSYRVLFLKTFNKKKVIVSVRNDPKIEYKNVFNRLIMKILYSNADGFVFQTEDAKNYFSKRIQANSVIIPNPINPSFIQEEYKGKREKTIVTVGRLETQKNHKLLIDSFNLIKDDFSDYNLFIYGSGSLENELKDYVKKLNLSKRIVFKGECDNIKEEIYKSSLFVLSSDYEGMPNALMEAMSLGLPVISTDCPCGGPKFLIKNNVSGLLVPVNDTKGLSEAITKILSDRTFADNISNEAHKISDLVNPDVINKKWVEYIKKVVK